MRQDSFFIFCTPFISSLSKEKKGGVQERMLHAGSKDALEKKLTGVTKRIQGTDLGDFKWENIEEQMRR